MLSLYQNTNDATPGKSLGGRRKTTTRQDRQLISTARHGHTRFVTPTPFHAGGKSQKVLLDFNVTGAVYLVISRENLAWTSQTFTENFSY